MTTRAKKMITLLLAFFVLAAAALSGCGKATGTGDDDAEGTTTKATQKQEAQKEELKPVKLSWYYIGNEAEENAPEVFEKANEMISEKINATVTFHRFSFGDYPKKMQLSIAAQEEMDLMFTADWSLNYAEIVSKGALLELESLIDGYAPGTKSLIPDKIWNGTKVAGKIYGVPNYQVSFRQPALIFKKELVDKHGLKDKIFAVQKMEDLTPIFETIKANEDDIIPTLVPPLWQKWDARTRDEYLEIFIGLPCGVNYDLEIIDTNNDEYFIAKDEADYKLAREWNEKGFFHKDVGLVKDFTPEMKAGKFFVLNDVYKPGIESDMKTRYGYDVYAVPMGMPVLSTGSITATLTGISRTSKNPERAMMLIEQMNTSKELYNLIVFGMEDKQYKKTGDNRIELIPESGYTGYAWMMGCQFNAYFLPGQEDDVWEETKRLNAEAFEAPTLGFVFDRNNVKTEVANINAVSKENEEIKKYGILEVDEYMDKLEESRRKINEAGLEAFKKELQSQLDVWKSSR